MAFIFSLILSTNVFAESNVPEIKGEGMVLMDGTTGEVLAEKNANEKLARLKDILDEYEITYTIPELNVKSYEYGKETHYYYDIGCDYIDHVGELMSWLDGLLSDSDKLFRYLFGNSIIITGNDNDDSYRDKMLIAEGEEVTDWGTYTLYGDLKPEFDKYEIYEKGN